LIYSFSLLIVRFIIGVVFLFFRSQCRELRLADATRTNPYLVAPGHWRQLYFVKMTPGSSASVSQKILTRRIIRIADINYEYSAQRWQQAQYDGDNPGFKFTYCRDQGIPLTIVEAIALFSNTQHQNIAPEADVLPELQEWRLYWTPSWAAVSPINPNERIIETTTPPVSNGTSDDNTRFSISPPPSFSDESPAHNSSPQWL
jgi:hypothetical protein